MSLRRSRRLSQARPLRRRVAGGNAAHSPAHYIKVVANTDGSFTVTNSRNGYSKMYAAR